MDFVTAEENIHRPSFHPKNNFTRENYKNTIMYGSGNCCKGAQQTEKHSFSLQHHSEKSRSTCGLCGRLHLLTPTLPQSHWSIRQGALLWVDQDKNMGILTSQLQSCPGTMISTWQGQFSDIFTTHHPKDMSQKLYHWQVLLRRWNLLGCIHPLESELYLSYGRLRCQGPQSALTQACL